MNGLEDEFLSKLSESERNSVSEVEMIFENLNSQLRDKMNKENLESSIEFRICNNEKSPLLRYTFSVSGKYKGRSSSYSLEKYGRLDSTSFSSDIIIDSKSCQNVIWTDRYQYFDSYEIKNVNGYWK